MKKLLIATSNPAKLAEYSAHLCDVPLQLISLKDLGLESVEETGETFRENALLKARAYFKQSGLPTLADDGGLAIESLGGEPGVYSRRWVGGKESSDEELIAYTLARLEGRPLEQREARLRLASAFIAEDGSEHVIETSIEGHIAEEASSRRREGYPFRSLFIVAPFGKYYDELTEKEHEAINHRVKAISMLKPIIREALC